MKPDGWHEMDDADLLALSLEPVPPGADVRRKLMQRIADEARLLPAVTVRAGAGEWQPFGVAGVAFKMLYRDTRAGTSTYLLRLDAGASLPAHRHVEAEQCMVLEGALQWQDFEYRAGDFVVAESGSLHPAIRSDGGALLLIVGGRTEAVAV